MKFDIAELIRVLAENCPNETVAVFIATYGVFIVAIILIVVVLVRTIGKTGSFKDMSDKEIKEMKAAIALITDNASKVAVDNAKVTDEIKSEIRANNDVTMQLMISFGLALGVNYTDITNIIEKSKSVYDASIGQYNALDQAVKDKIIEDEVKAAEIEKAAAIVKAQEEAKLKAEQEAKAQVDAQYKADLAAIKI